MARAGTWVDPRGRVNVVARVKVDGHELKRRLIVKGNDQDLAEEIARQLNIDFAKGDLSWFQKRKPREELRPRLMVTMAECTSEWLESCRPPVIGKRTWENYTIHIRALVERLGGDRRLDSIDTAEVMKLRSALQSEPARSGKPLSPATVKDRLGVLAMVFRHAVLQKAIDSSPFDVRLPRRRTKKGSGTQRIRKVQFRPFEAGELQALLKMLRNPERETELCYFPAIEMMLLTGLRWGEAAGVLWDDISWKGQRIHIRRAVVRGEDNPDEPTKTGAEWPIVLRPPLLALLRSQQGRTYLGRTDGRVFPGLRGGVMSYHEWRKRGWNEAIRKAQISPREGDAQKALRKSYVTSSLICGRNPKLVSEELGHANTRMVMEQYDTFIGPDAWPDTDEIALLHAIYSWGDIQVGRAPGGPSRAPANDPPTSEALNPRKQA